MRPIPPRWAACTGLLVLALFAVPGYGADLRNFEDAALHAVHFLDAREGWAVGDDGVVWHTNDSGKNWERQPTGVRASLRSVWFANPAQGWAAGREELPQGGSAGVLLYTRDGGWTWKRLLVNALPGLQKVRFVDEKVGYLVGDGSDLYTTGVFQTVDGGRNWQPMPGPRCPRWLAADFDANGGALAGAWNRLATVRRDKVFMVDMDTLGGRNLRGLQLRGDNGVAVGQGGLVLLSAGTRGSTWRYADLKLAPEVRAAWDFHAVHGTGTHIWAVGRPGSVALHSPDSGNTWETVRTGQNFPLHGIQFVNEKNGWAVGEMGTIVNTQDGGKTWAVQHRGGQKAAVLYTHARPAGLPIDTVALLGAQDGYLSAGVCVTTPDAGTAAPDKAMNGERFAAAFRAAGGASAESLWQFPVASHQGRANRGELVRSWDRLHGDRAAEQLLRQLVLAIRMWKPEVVVTDGSDAGPSGYGSDALIAEAAREAFARAADPKAFPEQLTALGLEAHKPAKIYGRCDTPAGAQVTLDLSAVSPVLGTSVQEFASAQAQLLDAPAVGNERGYQLLAANVEGAAGHKSLMQGVSLAPGGVARRLTIPMDKIDPEIVKGVRLRTNLRALATGAAGALTEPDRMLANLAPMLGSMPDDHAAPALHSIARHFAKAGQWTLAREAFLVLVDRYPAHPLALDGYRWLLAHNASSEARRRHELGQFMVVSELKMGQPKAPASAPAAPAEQSMVPEKKKAGKEGTPPRELPQLEGRQLSQLALFDDKDFTRKWYQSSLDLEPKLAAFGPIHAGDPAVQFCLQSARRNLGDFETPRKWYAQFASTNLDSPWRSAALAELWLANRTGAPPRPVLTCRSADSRPYLDGKLDDPCWQGGPAARLASAAGDTLTRYPTEVRMAYDADFLYVAVRCSHPEGKGVPAAKTRTRDGDLRGHDRISLVLDLDRDYATYFHFQVDARGCILEDCWGDKTWDPRWFVATHREPTSWTVEAAIPLAVLTGDRVTSGRSWAVNVLRVLPGEGVQAWSTPAEAPEEAIRPENLGLMLFAPEARKAAAADSPGRQP